MADAHIVGGDYMVGGFLWNHSGAVYAGQVNGVGGTRLNGNIASVQMVSEEQKKSLLKATATGLAGAAIAGPVGAVAGVVAGGNRQEILFICRLHSGRELLARGNSRIFELLVAESMKPRSSSPAPSRRPQPVDRSAKSVFKMILISFLVAIGLIFLLLLPSLLSGPPVP